jgi:hypothetical protein
MTKPNKQRAKLEHAPVGKEHEHPAEPAQVTAPERPPDIPDPRTKSQRHGKVTADKYNQ